MAIGKRSDQSLAALMVSIVKGITWDHSRGYSPLVAASQIFEDFHPEIDVQWAKRSLWEFGEGALGLLFDEYDLLVVDHPLIGHAAESGLLLPLDANLPSGFLATRARNSVGDSYESYTYGGHQWALPVDAAAMVSVSRADLWKQYDHAIPSNWTEVVAVAQRSRRVAIPLSPVNALCAFFSLCANMGSPPCHLGDDRVVDVETGEQALEHLRALVSIVSPECLGMDPIQLLNRMSMTDDWVYCPVTFGYCSYARSGYSSHELKFHNFPGPKAPHHAGAVLGGAGLAISARTKNRAAALELLAWLTGDACQSTVYAYSGGQPSSRTACRDEAVNSIANNFFYDTEPTVDLAYVRCNHPGMARFQTPAAQIVWHHLQGHDRAKAALAALDQLFQKSTRVT